MEVSALKYSGAGGLQGRSPLLRLQSDERLVNLIRRGNGAAFELLVSRYEARLLAFCRHMLGSREDAEDVLQEVMASAYNAIIADSRQINVRPWLYRIARNRSLNHLRRQQPIGVDSMDIHLSEHGTSTADKVHAREEFRMLVGDIHELPETQKTALVLRELDALSYEQIAEAMETTVPSVKSLLVRARVSLAEASEARLLTCDEVRIELAEVAEGLRKKPTSPVRRHVKGCTRCNSFESQVKRTNKALAALLPLGPLALLRKLLIAPLSHSAGGGAAGAAGSAGAAGAAGSAGAGAAGAGAAGAGAAGAGAAGAAGASAAGAGATAAGAAAAGGSGGLITAGVGALATKAAAGLAAAALVTAGAVEATHARHTNQAPTPTSTSHVADAVGSGVSQAKALGVGSTAAAAGPIALPANSGATATATGTSATPTNTTTAATTNTATGTTTAPAGTDTSTTATGTTTTATTPTGTSTSATTTEPTATAPAPPASTKTDAASGGTVTSSTGTQTSATGTTTARTSTSTGTSTSPVLSLR